MTQARRGIGRVVSRCLAVAALTFVAWIIPVRDRCWDPRAPTSTRAAVSRDPSGCVLHLGTGDTRIGQSECAQLKCEPGVISTFTRARPEVLAALMALYALGTLAWAARWRALLGFAGVDLPLSQVWRVSIEAQAGGVLLPGGIGGDALRVAAVLGRPTRPDEVRAPAVIVVASVLLDRAVGLALVAALAAVLGVASGGIGAGPLAAVLGAVPIALVVGLFVLRSSTLPRTRWLHEGRVGSVVGPLLAYVGSPRAPGAIARAAALSVVVAATQFGVIRGLVWALGGTPTRETWVYVGTAMAFIVAAVPALPGAWGTADAAYVFFFGLAGIGSPVALAVSLVYRVFWYVTGVVGAILHIARPRVSAQPAAGPD
jgi:uncharacterized membrane protein YbhN (UPF0104 family)